MRQERRRQVGFFHENLLVGFEDGQGCFLPPMLTLPSSCAALEKGEGERNFEDGLCVVGLERAVFVGEERTRVSFRSTGNVSPRPAYACEPA